VSAPPVQPNVSSKDWHSRAAGSSAPRCVRTTTNQSGRTGTQKPRLSAVTCAWRLPRTAAGKLLSLAAPGCSDVCQDWGVTIWYQRFDYDTQTWSGQGDANYYGATWRVRR
jgi:hypothetical protein